MRECPVMDHVPATSGPAAGFRFRARRIGCSEAPQRGDQSDLCGYTFVDYRRPSRRATSRSWRADVAQLVAHHLAKVRVAGSNPVIRSRCSRINPQRWSGRVVRQRPAKPCTRVRFPSPPPRWTRAISSAGERFPDTEEVTGSIPVSRTSITAVQVRFLPGLCCVVN